MLETLTHCPVCHQSDFQAFLTCQDHTVSGEEFHIVRCKNCGFKFTNPRPDESSIDQYYQSEDYISHSDTKRGLIHQIYHWVRKRALESKLQLVEQVYQAQGVSEEKKRLLDYGSGTGHFLEVCQQAGWEIYGLEPDTGARAKAKELLGKELEANLFEADFPSGAFQVVTLWHVLEHVHQLDRTIAHLKQLLSPEGRLVVAVPNHKSWDAQTFQSSWAAYDVPRHLYHFAPDSLERLFANHGMQLERYLPMYYDAYYISLLSGQYKRGWMNYPLAVWQGFRSNQWAAQHKNLYSSLIYIIRK